MNEKVLVTGASGQIGSELVEALRLRYGTENVLATDIKDNEGDPNFLMLDIVNKQRFLEILSDNKITTVYHLAAILSAHGEWNPKKTWNVNFNGTIHLLNLAKDGYVKKIFFPSTIAVHGPETPKKQTPQFADFSPETVYGMSKIAGELWCNYYHKKYGVDVRSVRYPGIIGWKNKPHGGTTDYAVEIFYDAVEHGRYTCFLKPDTVLPMMYIDDAINGTIQLMEAPASDVKIRTSYNLAAVSFTPAELASLIKQQIPNFEIDYAPDERQAIADGWSESIDDAYARNDWNWSHEFDTNKIVNVMIENLKIKLK